MQDSTPAIVPTEDGARNGPVFRDDGSKDTGNGPSPSGLQLDGSRLGQRGPDDRHDTLALAVVDRRQARRGGQFRPTRPHAVEAAGKRFGAQFPIGGDGAGRWDGETIVCIASGPSLCAEDLEAVREAVEAGQARAITTNATAFSAPWASVHYGSDAKWWTFHLPDGRLMFEDVRARCRGEPWTTSGGTHRHLGRQGMRFVRGISQQTGLSRKPGAIHFGGNSGHAAIGLAYHFGAGRIILLGYDMQRTGGESHHHGDHPKGLGNPGGGILSVWAKRYGALAEDLRRARVPTVNASRETALQCFPRAPIVEALQCR